MADTTKRQSIIDEVKERFGTILAGEQVTKHNGKTHVYACEVGPSRVYSWKGAPMQNIDIPGINIKDTKNTTAIAAQLHEHTLFLDLELFATSGSELRALIGDVTACIGSDLTWSGLADDTKPISDEDIAVVQKGTVIAGCSLGVVIEYTTDPWDPTE